MNLRRTIRYVRSRQKELALFNIASGDPVREKLAAFFRTQNVKIATEETVSGAPANLAVLSTGRTVLEVVDVEILRDLVNRSTADPHRVGVSETAYEDILTHLKETTFTSQDTEDMLYASREIEDRARRSGTGTIHAGFQQCSNIVEQRAIYHDLARSGVDVHAYGVADVTPPDLADGQVHAVEDELADLWFVLFDGGGERSQKSALLAEERGEGDFYGFWTYDATIINSVCEHLEQTYLSVDEQSPHSGA